jgi:hypothetical protein
LHQETFLTAIGRYAKLMKRVFSLAVAAQTSMINLSDFHRDWLTKNPVGLNRRSGFEIMGIESERHH